jgi:hypothetical protein
MRRLTLAALAAALVLAACNDREPGTAPAEPTPEETFGATCQVERFPLLAAVQQTKIVFPKGRLQLEADVRVGAIKLLWDTCKPTLARKGVFLFLDWMNRNASLLKPNTEAARNKLIKILFEGTGLSAPPPISLGPTSGMAFLDGSSAEVVGWKTANRQAAGAAQKNAFGDGVPAIVTTTGLADDFPLITQPPPSPGAAGLRALELALQPVQQFPPFYDYNVSTPTDNHIVVNGTLLVGFCLRAGVTYPEGIQIGHNPVQINEGQPSGLPFFEVLREAPSAAEYAQLGLPCPPEQVNGSPPPIGLELRGGLSDFAFSAWRTAKHYVGPVVETLFLPSPLQAVQVSVEGIARKTRSFSPFGVVVDQTLVFFRDEAFGNSAFDPSGKTFFSGQTINWPYSKDGSSSFAIAYPAVQVLDGNGVAQSGVQVTVSLVGANGALAGTLTRSTSAESDFAGPNTAVFDNLSITLSDAVSAGTYRLKFTAMDLPGAPWVESDDFNVQVDNF